MFRFACLACGLSEWKTLPGAYSRCFGRPVDPWFALPLWLQLEFRGQLLWAYNREHLEILRSGIESKLRDVWRPETHNLLHKLPKWMLLGKNREDLLRRIERLQRV